MEKEGWGGELSFFGKILTPAFVQVAEKVIRNLELNPEEVREDAQKCIFCARTTKRKLTP